MNKRVIAVLVGPLLAMIAATVWVPVTYEALPYGRRNVPSAGGSYPLHIWLPRENGPHFAPIWRTRVGRRSPGVMLWYEDLPPNGFPLDEPVLRPVLLAGELMAILAIASAIVLLIRLCTSMLVHTVHLRSSRTSRPPASSGE